MRHGNPPRYFGGYFSIDQDFGLRWQVRRDTAFPGRSATKSGVALSFPPQSKTRGAAPPHIPANQPCKALTRWRSSASAWSWLAMVGWISARRSSR